MWNVKSIFLLSIYFMMFEIRSLSSEVFMLQPPGGRSDSVFDVSCLGEAGCFYACNQIWSKPSYHSPVVFCCVLTHKKERIWPFYAHTYKQIKKQLFSCGINCLMFGILDCIFMVHVHYCTDIHRTSGHWSEKLN